MRVAHRAVDARTRGHMAPGSPEPPGPGRVIVRGTKTAVSVVSFHRAIPAGVTSTTNFGIHRAVCWSSCEKIDSPAKVIGWGGTIVSSARSASVVACRVGGDVLAYWMPIASRASQVSWISRSRRNIAPRFSPASAET
jgi:hypothetical protein